MKNSKELLRIDPQTKERWQWIRIYEGRSLEEPTGRYVCTHLKPGERPISLLQIAYYDGPEEQVVEELAEIASDDPSALDCHYTIRLCAACADVYQANVDRRNRRITVKSNEELRGYLMGLEDGFVESKLQDDIADKYTDMGKFDELFKLAHAFADRKGEEFYRDHVETVNFNPDGTRSRGYSAVPGAAPREKYSAEQLRWEGSAVVPKSSPISPVVIPKLVS